MDRKNVIRFCQGDFGVIAEHFQAAGKKESQVFALCSRATSRRCNIYICNRLIIPDANELRNQTSASVEPSKRLQAIVYGLAYETGSSIGDLHSHPFTDSPHFSSIDDHHGRKNARYLAEYLPDGATMIMVVFGKDLKEFECRVWDRERSCFEPAERLEILGSPTQILEAKPQLDILAEDPYARLRIIPGWQQGRLEALKVFVAGLGGNGSLSWQDLVALGVGRNSGWLKGCDPDVLEASNVPRIPFARPKDIGRSKAAIASSYAHRKSPGIKAFCYQESLESDKMQRIAAEANVIVGCVDRDGPRKIYNRLAVRYLIPLVDIRSEIIPAESSYEAVGQVQIVIPGRTGCLMCSGMIDPSEAALDLLTEDQRQARANMGYVRGTGETPTPSVMHLNGVTSHLATSQFLRLVFGEEIGGKEFLHYDRQKCQLVAASVPSNSNCPVCGLKGYVGSGDELPGVEPPDKESQGQSSLLLDGVVIEEPSRHGTELDSKEPRRSPERRHNSKHTSDRERADDRG
jgi:molybdopterin/thiamine biosynthesis adenylyltransferase